MAPGNPRMMRDQPMLKYFRNEQSMLELMLILVAVLTAFVAYHMEGYRLVTLNLFYLPVVLSGFYLGRYRSGVLALFCVLAASLILLTQLQEATEDGSPLSMLIGIVLWGSVLCLTSILVGTLSDERTTYAKELHEAYVGVVEVLSNQLQGGTLNRSVRATRIIELSREVATQMRLSPIQIDNIEAAVLLHGLGNVEITTRVIRRAIDSLETKNARADSHSFQGIDLVQSLGTVLRGVIPMLANQDSAFPAMSDESPASAEIPLGAKIIRTVRAFDALVSPRIDSSRMDSDEALAALEADTTAEHSPEVLSALRRVVSQNLVLIEA